MAPHPYGRSALAVQAGPANGIDQAGPPPSTLAAQLVENMTVSNRSARIDDMSELQRLAAEITAVKNDSTLLKTPEDRIEHNHMLIYVYARVVLDGLKWDDPFANLDRLQGEALKAIGFLKVTFRETPAVLECRAPIRPLEQRGEEPLWLWILPKVLKILGHGHCIGLSSAIEQLLQDIFYSVSPVGPMWHMCTPMMQYLQAIVTAVVEHLRPVSGPLSHPHTDLVLPPTAFLESATADRVSAAAPSGCSYTLVGAEHCIRHAKSLVTVIKDAISRNPGAEISLVFAGQLVWTFDTVLALYMLQKAYRRSVPFDDALAMRHVLGLIDSCTKSDNVDPTVLQKGYSILAILCHQSIDQVPPILLEDNEQGSGSRETLTPCLIELARGALEYKPVARLVSSQLIGPLEPLIAENAIIGFGTDFGRSFQVLKHVANAARPGAPRPDFFSDDFNLSDFVDDALRRRVQKLPMKPKSDESPHPAPKRRKVSPESAVVNEIISRVLRLAKLEASADANHLVQHLPSAFANMRQDEQCKAIDLVASIPCAVDGTLRFVLNHATWSTHLQCSLCYQQEHSQLLPTAVDDVKGKALESLLQITRLTPFVESKRPRVIAMVSLRRMIRHCRSPETLDLEKCALGQWCLQALQSSHRELRIAAGRTLAEYLRDQPASMMDEDVIRRNRSNTIGLLKTLSDKNQPLLFETCIMAWGQVGRTVSDDGLNLVLSKLIEYLGHRNQTVSAFAFNETLNLANARGTTPKSLFSPFWKTLAFSVVKDLVSRPQTTSMVAELLQIGVPDLLVLLQSHVLPWLVLGKKKDVIQKIAEARGEEETWEPCVFAGNLKHILAILLIQDTSGPDGQAGPSIEEYAMSLLQHASPHFKDLRLVDLLRTEPLLTALELLKLGGEGDDVRKCRVRSGLTTMATLLMGKPKSKKDNIVGQYLQNYALGLTSRLSDDINETVAGYRLAPREQRVSIRAIEEMIRLCKSYARIARPHISACLLTAMASDELRSAAFSCWDVMLTHMEVEDVESQIETTFFIISHYWSSFDAASREKCKVLLRVLMLKHKDTVGKYGKRLPSLSHIEELGELRAQLEELRRPADDQEAFVMFARRLGHENVGVVLQALSELAEYLQHHQDWLQRSAVSQQPDAVVTGLMRALLDCSAKYGGLEDEVVRLCTKCIGLVGCLDSNRLETTRERKQFVVIYNFEEARETTSFVAFLLENVLVKAFLSATDTKMQGFLSYAMQELLGGCDFRDAVLRQGREGEEVNAEVTASVLRKWNALPELTREVLTPFLSSRYVLGGPKPQNENAVEYPMFRSGKPYTLWLKALVVALLGCGQNVFSSIVFQPLSRVIRVKDLSVAEFLLPYVALHVVAGQDQGDLAQKITEELLAILQHHPLGTATHAEKEEAKVYYEAVFRILDYFMRWLQLRRSQPGQQEDVQIKRVQRVIDSLPPELLSQRAFDCKQYARALFFLEPSLLKDGEMRVVQGTLPGYQSLQHIYAEIDEPDALEGLFAIMPNLDLGQETQGHRKAGRWTAAQTWYEVQLAESPDDVDVQLELLTCLKESGQHDVLLNYVEGLRYTSDNTAKVLPFAVEASWATGRWQTMEKYLAMCNGDSITETFNLGVGQALLCLKRGDEEAFKECIEGIRQMVAGSMTQTTTSSLHEAHDAMLKCHVLSELEMIRDNKIDRGGEKVLHQRLEVLGAYVNDKQYLLGIRRAAMELMRPKYADQDISPLWLASAKLARKSGSTHQSFNAVLHAQKLHDPFALIENSKLLWRDGHHRKAIQGLERAISDNHFHEIPESKTPSSSRTGGKQANLLAAKAHLLLAKWLDSTGQTQAEALTKQYRKAPKIHPCWEKGHYHLGRHYKKLMEYEKQLKPEDQSEQYMAGDYTKLIVENYLRSLSFGAKYLNQTLPRILTLWLDLAAQLDRDAENRIISGPVRERRKKTLMEVHKNFRKQMSRMSAYIFYTALPQIVARIMHPHPDVFKMLEEIIVKVVVNYPRQALWSVMSCMPSNKQAAPERRIRSQQVWTAIKCFNSGELKALLKAGEKMGQELLLACINGDFTSNRTVTCSLTRDLRFKHACTPCPLVVPVESCVMATLPTLTDDLKRHKPFSRDVITLDSFLDDVLVLGSLAKPRRLTAIGSDGKKYSLLIKPKDDLRTDQRLMDFNNIINRALKRDADSSRRQLYIRTYAVTPLNDECGIIEWVDGLRTMREILLELYKSRGIAPNYTLIAQLMADAARDHERIELYTVEVCEKMFKPVMAEWFITQFPDPSAWFAARVTYTRSCAVMSMVGTILGLGDRHGENLLLEQGTGGILHVDFNCLFDKGQTFAQPERVPFRLTRNMRTAMGPYGYEGPFRRCCELTLRLLRQQEETLMTILEAFIYDPTMDLQKEKKPRKGDAAGARVPGLQHPTSVVESIRRKVRGLMAGETIPLGVEGQVEELIRQAVDPRNLTAMYIGWCPFL